MTECRKLLSTFTRHPILEKRSRGGHGNEGWRKTFAPYSATSSDASLRLCRDDRPLEAIRATLGYKVGSPSQARENIPYSSRGCRVYPPVTPVVGGITTLGCRLKEKTRTVAGERESDARRAVLRFVYWRNHTWVSRVSEYHSSNETLQTVRGENYARKSFHCPCPLYTRGFSGCLSTIAMKTKAFRLSIK